MIFLFSEMPISFCRYVSFDQFWFGLGLFVWGFCLFGFGDFLFVWGSGCFVLGFFFEELRAWLRPELSASVSD